jgi:hypothetical protein
MSDSAYSEREDEGEEEVVGAGAADGLVVDECTSPLASPIPGKPQPPPPVVDGVILERPYPQQEEDMVDEDISLQHVDELLVS